MAPRRLYLDNASTSFPKAPGVMEAMQRYATELGASAGRAAYDEAVETGQLISRCRQRLNSLFNGADSSHFIFTLNCTEALNLAIKGLIDPTKANHAICCEIDHNSIIRPLHALESRGWTSVTLVPVEPNSGRVDPEDIRRAIRPETRLIAVTHASNVTGAIQPVNEIGAIAREREIPIIVDAAQTAGHVPIDLANDPIDLLALPGHKGLLGPLGTGVLYIRPGLENVLRPLVEGGTGSMSEQPMQPDHMPDRFESGSHNAIGIIGLSAALKWIDEQTVQTLFEHDRDLVRAFIEGASDVEGLRYFGPQGVKDRVSVFSVRIEGIDPHELSAILETEFGILTRSGLHCAPYIHQAIGTTRCGGTTRLSFGPFLSLRDVKFATDALAHVAANSAVRAT